MKPITMYESDRGQRFDTPEAARNADMIDTVEDKLLSVIDDECNGPTPHWDYLRNGGALDLIEALKVWLENGMPFKAS